jgi:hypothetical protein
MAGPLPCLVAVRSFKIASLCMGRIAEKQVCLVAMLPGNLPGEVLENVLYSISSPLLLLVYLGQANYVPKSLSRSNIVLPTPLPSPPFGVRRRESTSLPDSPVLPELPVTEVLSGASSEQLGSSVTLGDENAAFGLPIFRKSPPSISYSKDQDAKRMRWMMKTMLRRGCVPPSQLLVRPSSLSEYPNLKRRRAHRDEVRDRDTDDEPNEDGLGSLHDSSTLKTSEERDDIIIEVDTIEGGVEEDTVNSGWEGEQPRRVPCPVAGCNKSYKNSNGLRYHMHHSHSTNSTSISSPSNSTALGSPSQGHNSTGDSPKKGFTASSDGHPGETSKSEAMAAAITTGRALRCPTPGCTRVYLSASGLRYHLRAVHTPKARPTASDPTEENPSKSFKISQRKLRRPVPPNSITGKEPATSSLLPVPTVSVLTDEVPSTTTVSEAQVMVSPPPCVAITIHPTPPPTPSV